MAATVFEVGKFAISPIENILPNFLCCNVLLSTSTYPF